YTVTHLGFGYHLGVLYMALISGTLAFTLLNMGQKTIELSEAAIFMYLYPIFSGILAIIVLGDKMTPVIILSAIITFIGVAIAEVKKKRS
ncbi:MAG: EamA family transporter, partial [Microgenomates group bacterium]